MPREIRITDDRQRDARVGLASPKRPPPRRMVAAGGRGARFTSLIKVPEGRDYASLARKHGDDDEALARALVDGDPDLDVEVVGREVGPADRVWVKQDGSILYTGTVLQVTLGPDEQERERKDFVDVEATVGDDALPFSGRLFPVDEVVHRFALSRRLQLRHNDGLTFEFLHDLARVLHESRKMLLVGAGARAAGPLIFQRNGTPYRGFLAGRVDGDAYVLALHLSNLELKRPAPRPSPPAHGGGEA